jgi:hypothetical protein
MVLISWGLLRQNMLLHKMTGWRQILKKNGILDLTIIIASAYPVSFIIKSILVWFENFGI